VSPTPPSTVEHPCRNCGAENPRWPFGLCPSCQRARDERDSAYADVLAHSAYLTYLATRMMRD
jgi:predicted ATP-dependent serine protease